MVKKLILLLTVTALLCTGCAAQEALVKRSVTGFYFDTVVTISAFVPDDVAIRAALDKCADYERLLSKTVEGSDVWNINHADGQPVAVSEATLEVLHIAQDIARQSGGAFDITVAPAVALWDFTGDGHVVPDEGQVAEAARRVDHTRIEISGDRVTVPADMQIDLGGVAKGYICDRIAEEVRAAGIERALFNFGGNVIAIGQKPDGASWTVGIQDPKKPTGESLIVANIVDMAVVTSGIYERGFDVDGVRYHHLLDPKTGWPMQNELASATIFCQSSGLADALSTATFILGAEAGLAFIEGMEGVEALLITRDNEIIATSGALALLRS